MAALLVGASGLLLAVPTVHSAPDDWEFTEMVVEPRLTVHSIAIAPGGRMAFSGEKLNELGERIQAGVYLQESADSPAIPLALRGEALPGGLGVMGFVEDIRVDPSGRVLIKVSLENEPTPAVLRWEKGEISRMLPDEKDFEHHLDYLTSDGRWIVEDERLSNRNSNAILTYGVDFVRLPQGFGPRSLPC